MRLLCEENLLIGIDQNIVCIPDRERIVCVNDSQKLPVVRVLCNINRLGVDRSILHKVGQLHRLLHKTLKTNTVSLPKGFKNT